MKPVSRQFQVITEARAMKVIPGYQRFLVNGMKPKRPRGYVIQIVPPICDVKNQPDDVEGIGACYHNIGKPIVQYYAGWYLYKEDAKRRALEMVNNSYFNRPDVHPKTHPIVLLFRPAETTGVK